MRPFMKCLSAALLFALVTVPHPAGAANVGTAFTYQGRLDKSGAPYSGDADFKFRLYADSTGAQVGTEFSASAVPVVDGLFTVRLDFGSVFTGQALWLETDVKTTGDAGYTTLAPRTAMLAVPYAVRALNGPAGSSQWVNDASGIDYGGHVGVGTASIAGSQLVVSAGTTNVNPLWVNNNNASYAALSVANYAVNGFGIFDNQSDRHYLTGRLGFNVLDPGAQVELSSSSRGVKATAYGTTLDVSGDYQAALYGIGMKDPSFPAPAGGVVGKSYGSRGVAGVSDTDFGVSGDCTSAGTYGLLGTPSEGVRGVAADAGRYGGTFTNTAVGGVALKADGLAQVKTLQILGADLAERFPVEGGTPEPGTVLMLGDRDDGALRTADEPYSRRVAGVVSGANGLDAAVVLEGHTFDDTGGVPVAVSGRVWVHCDATRTPIHRGDLLTTAGRPGYAMAASDRERAYGAILGKAMTSLATGTGDVLVLVNLQ